MLKVGITGGIGSGKTKVCNIWQSLGAYIINADDLAKKIMVHNEAIKKEITNVFGSESYYADGQLNRAYLAEEAFAKNRVEELNAIVHPRIPQEVERIMERAAQGGHDVVVYEAALLLQNVRPAYLDNVVLILADKQKRIKRVALRDDVEKKEVLDRINKQQNFDKLKDQADIVIQNNSSIEDLERQAEEIYQQFVSASGD